MIDFNRSHENGVTFRPVCETDDTALLFRIFASTREEILAFEGWNDQQKDAFLRQQFALQHNAYMKGYKNPLFYILSHREEEAGRLYLNICETDLRIIDIALLPFARGRGIGSAVISDLLAWSRERRKTVSIHVERQNPARRLYERMGFVCRKTEDVYLLMEHDCS